MCYHSLEKTLVNKCCLQSMKDSERRSLTPLQLRKKAAEFALKTVDAQREQFKRCVRVIWRSCAMWHVAVALFLRTAC